MGYRERMVIAKESLLKMESHYYFSFFGVPEPKKCFEMSTMSTSRESARTTKHSKLIKFKYGDTFYFWPKSRDARLGVLNNTEN